jgi:hypothetical protein
MVGYQKVFEYSPKHRHYLVFLSFDGREVYEEFTALEGDESLLEGRRVLGYLCKYASAWCEPEEEFATAFSMDKGSAKFQIARTMCHGVYDKLGALFGEDGRADLMAVNSSGELDIKQEVANEQPVESS